MIQETCTTSVAASSGEEGAAAAFASQERSQLGVLAERSADSASAADAASDAAGSGERAAEGTTVSAEDGANAANDRCESRLQRVPGFNWAAFLVPFLWGPANGMMLTILFYPAWCFLDSLIYIAVHQPEWWTIALAVFSAALMVLVCFRYAQVGQVRAFKRAVEHGHDANWYNRRQRIWAVFAVVFVVVAVILATYYNLYIKPGLL